MGDVADDEIEDGFEEEMNKEDEYRQEEKDKQHQLVKNQLIMMKALQRLLTMNKYTNNSDISTKLMNEQMHTAIMWGL